MNRQSRVDMEPDLHDGATDADFVELSEEQLIGMQGIDVTFDRRAAEWLAQENYEQQTAKVYLYKFDDPKTGNAKALVDSWENEIPEQHEIGLQHGSGRYLLMITIPGGEKQKRGIRGWRFRLHPHYDELRAAYMREQAMIAPQGPYPFPARGGNGQQADPLSAGLDAVGKLVGVLAPLLTARQQDNGGGNMAGLMMQMYKGMGDVMKASARENVEFYGDLQRQIAGLPAPSEEGEDMEEKGMLERVIPLLAEYVPVMLGKGPGAKATAATVRQLPMFKQVVKSKAELTRIVSYMDQKYGPEQTDTLLARLHVTRPKGAKVPLSERVRPRPMRRARTVEATEETETLPDSEAASVAASVAATG